MGSPNKAQQIKTIKPLRQTPTYYIYGIEGETEYIFIPFSKIEWFLNQLLRIKTQAESEALCSFSFDWPDGFDMFYADNYPPQNDLDHKIQRHRRTRKKIKEGMHPVDKAKMERAKNELVTRYFNSTHFQKKGN